MKKTQSLMFVLAVALTLLAFGTVALAADTAANPPAKPAVHKKEAAAKKAPEGPKCVVKGKVEAKIEKNKKGKEIQVYSITVAEAKDAEGKALDALKGKVLHIGGMSPKALKELVGKDTELKGVVVNNRRLVVEQSK